MNKAIEIYNNKKSVDGYVLKKQTLYPEELAIFNLITKKKRKETMLDLGVGTGRTTIFFAPMFEKYYANDIALAMIEYCKNRFADKANYIFKTEDAVNIRSGNYPSLDFIFFSGQGITFLENEQELETFILDINAILASDGIFAFSFHNAQGVEKLYKFQIPLNPLNLVPEIRKCIMVRKINGDLNKYLGRDHFRLNDATLYLKPSYLLSILRNNKFFKITALNRKGEVISNSKIDECHDNIIHLICYKN